MGSVGRRLGVPEREPERVRATLERAVSSERYVRREVTWVRWYTDLS